jgi:hypothetical protein
MYLNQTLYDVGQAKQHFLQFDMSRGYMPSQLLYKWGWAQLISDYL